MTHAERILAVIPARRGSKGLPGKNIRPLAGLPLIVHSIRLAQSCPAITRTVVSTDASDIAEVARQAGAEVPFIRPAALAQDDTPMWPVIRHALAFVENEENSAYDYVLLLDPTSPGRLPEDIAGACQQLRNRPLADGIIGVSQPDYNPIWHCVQERDGWMTNLVESGDRFVRRQDLPAIYRINASLYLWRTKFVRREEGNWRKGQLLMYVIPESRAIHIDNLEEFNRCEMLMREGSIRLPWVKQRGSSAGKGTGVREIRSLMNMSGRRVLLTGGAGKIGATVAEGLIELGATVAILDRDAEACKSCAVALGPLARAVPCDLLDEAATRSAVRHTIEMFGGLDVLIHCAAFVGTTEAAGWNTDFERQTVAAWDNAMRVNLTAAFVMAQEAYRALSATGKGSIILFSSIYGMTGPDASLYAGTNVAHPAGYGASKAGLLQLTRYLATTLAPSVRVNAISPGGVWRQQPEAFRRRYEVYTPLKRMATEEDLKGAVAYLASELSAYVTGQNLVVDGGWTAW